ncbi:RNA polymerase sigma factor [Kineococcus sp. R86509]|uniref:RNA polymerase sigma factor n=1 Tax=Kineococcus sp. R86509 TaxID=3093851 RepID=UPI0036D406D7
MATPPLDPDRLAASGTNPEAFRVLYQRHAEALLRYCFTRVPEAEAAYDLLAETFAHAYLHRDTFDSDRGPVIAWLTTIARSKSLELHRRRRSETRALTRLGVQVEALDDESIARIDDLVDARAHRRRLRDALARLGRRDREAVTLRVVQQLNYTDVAQHLGCSPGAARVRVHRALSRLATHLEVNP